MALAARPIQFGLSGPLQIARGVAYGQGYARGDADPVGGINQNAAVRGDDSHRNEGQDFGYGGYGRQGHHPRQVNSPVVFESASEFAAIVANIGADQEAAKAAQVNGRKEIIKFSQGAQAYEHAAFYGGGHHVPLGAHLSLSL